MLSMYKANKGVVSCQLSMAEVLIPEGDHIVPQSAQSVEHRKI